LTVTKAHPARALRAHWVAALGAASATFADAAFDPAHRHVPLCPFKGVTGWWCPLCGGLRSVNALVRGHWAAAWHANALFIISLPLIVLYWLDWRRHSAARPPSRPAVIAVVVVMAAFTVLRNIPPMSALRP
jgi:hypothetical protein